MAGSTSHMGYSPVRKDEIVQMIIMQVQYMLHHGRWDTRPKPSATTKTCFDPLICS
jgi:hypothetical protein